MSARTVATTRLVFWLLTAAAAGAMLAWSWGTWPDPLVDYGTHLYVPWRLSVGQVLYRDLAYYNGPLSPYVNATLFRCFGVGMHTLIVANLLILVVALLLSEHLIRRASGPIAAGGATLTFVLIFAFGQSVGIGNYNWVTPYAHEFTHGLVLGAITLACVHRFQLSGRARWLTVGGLSCGLAVLTKAELSAAALAGGGAQLVAGLWVDQAGPGRWTRVLGTFAAATLAPPLLAAGLLAGVLPLKSALLAAAGSWPWVFDRRVTALPFYRGMVGLDAVPRHLLAMLQWVGIYLAVAGPAVGLSFALRRRSLPLKLLSALVLVLGMGVFWSRFRADFNAMFTPLPLVLMIAGGCVVLAVVRARSSLEQNAKSRLALRLGGVVFSLTLLPKMILAVHLFHYGFVLALPGTLVLVAIGVEEQPRWLAAHGGSGSAFRAVAIAVAGAVVYATFVVDQGYFATKQWTILPGTPDSFRGASRALEVQQIVQLIDRTTTSQQTVVVFPQGLMINYLARRRSATRFVNFMPPEVITAGEDTILADLKIHPPDAVVLTTDTLDPMGMSFTLDQQYSYGSATLAWIKQNYEVVAMPTLRPPLGTYLRMWLMRPVRR